MRNSELYVSGIISDDENIINYIRLHMDSFFDKSANITVSRRKNITGRLEALFLERHSAGEDKYRVRYKCDRYPGVPELYRANDAFFVNADKAMIFWDKKDVYTIQEILLLLQRGIKVNLFQGDYNDPIIELSSINDLLSVLPPKKEGTKSYGEELTIPNRLNGPCHDYSGAEQYHFTNSSDQPVGFSEAELVYLTETTGYSMDDRKEIYEEIMSQTDIILNLVELAQNGEFKIQSIKMTAWQKHQEIIDALDSLELKPNEHLLVFNNWRTINMFFTNKVDMLAYLSHIRAWSGRQGRITIQKYVCSDSQAIFPPKEIDQFSDEPVMVLDTEYYYEGGMIYDFRKYSCTNGFSTELSCKTGFRRDYFGLEDD